MSGCDEADRRRVGGGEVTRGPAEAMRGRVEAAGLRGKEQEGEDRGVERREEKRENLLC